MSQPKRTDLVVTLPDAADHIEKLSLGQLQVLLREAANGDIAQARHARAANRQR